MLGQGIGGQGGNEHIAHRGHQGNEDAVAKFILEEYSKGNPTTIYQAKYDGPLPTELPCSKTLTLGVGVRVMTICNDKNYKNGMLGTVKSLSDDKIVVKFDI